jgi:hypothetical protein
LLPGSQLRERVVTSEEQILICSEPSRRTVLEDEYTRCRLTS